MLYLPTEDELRKELVRERPDFGVRQSLANPSHRPFTPVLKI